LHLDDQLIADRLGLSIGTAPEFTLLVLVESQLRELQGFSSSGIRGHGFLRCGHIRVTGGFGGGNRVRATFTCDSRSPF